MVGLAAVFTSIGSVLADVSDISTLHMVTAYLGVLIGKKYPHQMGLSNWDRRRYVHWVDRGFPETFRSYVFETYDTAR